MGLGAVARNQEGQVLWAVSRRVRAWWSVEVAEGKALCLALKTAKAQKESHIIMESDCQSIISRLSKGAIYLSELDSILEDSLVRSKDFSALIWTHVRREANTVAHHIARFIPFGEEQRWINHCPPEFSPYVLMDSLAIS